MTRGCVSLKCARFSRRAGRGGQEATLLGGVLRVDPERLSSIAERGIDALVVAVVDGRADEEGMEENIAGWGAATKGLQGQVGRRSRNFFVIFVLFSYECEIFLKVSYLLKLSKLLAILDLGNFMKFPCLCFTPTKYCSGELPMVSGISVEFFLSSFGQT